MKRRSLPPLAAPVALVALLAGVLLFLGGRSDDGSSTKRPASTVNSAPESSTPGSGDVDPAPGTAVPAEPTTATRSLLVVVDGWSARILEGAPLWVDAGAAGRQDLRLVPLEAGTVADLRVNHPSVLGTVVARMTSAGPQAGCTAERCVDGAGATVSDDQLATPATLANLGPVFADWSVTAGVWAATVTVPRDALTVTVHTTRTGWSPAVIVVDDRGENEDVAAPRQVVAVAAGLGRLFPSTPAFVGADPYVGPIYPAFSDASVDPAASTPFVSGLSAVEPAAVDLDATWLTYLTSPSTGCGVGVLCVPDTTGVAADVEVLARETRGFCVVGTDARVEVEYLDAAWRIDYRLQTHQGGAWYGVTPEPVAGDSMLFLGTPALVSGPVELRVTTARIAGADFGSHALRGQVLHAGFDSPASLATPAAAIFERTLRVPEGFEAC